MRADDRQHVSAKHDPSRCAGGPWQDATRRVLAPPSRREERTRLVADRHLLHQVPRLEVAHALPRRRTARLEVVDAELPRAGNEKGRVWDGHVRGHTLTSLPLTTRESGSAFMSQCLEAIVGV